MQLTNIIATVNDLLDEDGVRRPVATITDTVNDGYRLISVLTQACEHSVSYLSNTGSFVSPLPIDFYSAVSVYFNSTRLYPVRFPDLAELDPAWMTTAAGTPLYYTTVGALTPTPQLWLYPAPLAVGTVRLTYAAVPGPLLNGPDVPEFPREHHYTLVWWSYAWELLKERPAILANKAFQTLAKFLENVSALQQYVYRRTPDRDWVSPPIDAEAVRRKMFNLEQAIVKSASSIETQALTQ